MPALLFSARCGVQITRYQPQLSRWAVQNPESIPKVAIGLKGGIALQQHVDTSLIYMYIVVVIFGLTLPLIAYLLLRYHYF